MKLGSITLMVWQEVIVGLNEAIQSADRAIQVGLIRKVVIGAKDP